ncbi:MAG: hypothetical protein JWQ04_1606 [Pedosphaera sp.]|nr:hypothetical protein [Pedosphaera sp.]
MIREWTKRDDWFSLSAGERAGVRAGLKTDFVMHYFSGRV